MSSLREESEILPVRRFGVHLNNLPTNGAPQKSLKPIHKTLPKAQTAAPKPSETAPKKSISKKAKSTPAPKQAPQPATPNINTEKKLAFSLSPPRHQVDKVIEELVAPVLIPTPPFERKAPSYVYTRDFLLQWETYRTVSPIADAEITLILRLDEPDPVPAPVQERTRVFKDQTVKDRTKGLEKPKNKLRPEHPIQKTREKGDKLKGKAKESQTVENAPKAKPKTEKLSQEEIMEPIVTEPAAAKADEAQAQPTDAQTPATQQATNPATPSEAAPVSGEKATQGAAAENTQGAPQQSTKDSKSGDDDDKETKKHKSSGNKENEQPSTNDEKKKEKESNEKRLAQRQKQIDFGKNTDGYTRYRELVPKNKRRRGHLRTPDKYQICSKRSWDGQIRKWRRFLHLYDNPELTKDSRLPTKDDLKDDDEDKLEDFDKSDSSSNEAPLAEQKTSANENSELSC